MSWLAPDDSPRLNLTELLAHRSELQAGYARFYKRFWGDELVPRRLLELARLRIAAIHSCEPQWLVRDDQVALSETEVGAIKTASFAGFEPLEQQVLNLAEKIPFGHHQITDQDVADLVAELGPASVVSLLTALAFFDVNSRLNQVFAVQSETRSSNQGVHQAL